MTTSGSVEFTELSKLIAEQKQILRKLDMSRAQLEKLASSFSLDEKQRNLYERLVGLEWITSSK